MIVVEPTADGRANTLESPLMTESLRPKTSPTAFLSLCLVLAVGCTPRDDARTCAGTATYEAFRDGIFEAGLYSGGPDELYEMAGRNTLATGIISGLMPDHTVLDIGAGSLRIGWWLVQYIEPANYHAIEPVRERIDAAEQILGADIHTYYNTDFEFPDVEFDFVIARSIWTHASKTMISKMLSEFAENAAPDGKFLASVIFPRIEAGDYKGEQWVGRVDKGDIGGMVKHSRRWLEEECQKNGLAMEIGGSLALQTWVLISRAPTPAA